MHFIVFFSIILGTALTEKIDVSEDFGMKVQFRLDKLNTKWSPKGTVSFIKRKGKNNRSAIEIKNEKITKETKSLLEKECELHGNYFISFTTDNNVFYSSVDPCDIIDNNYQDLYLIDGEVPIKESKINAIKYDPDEDSDYDDDEDSDKVKYRTKVRVRGEKIATGPRLVEEEEKAKKEGKDEENQRSFFSRYWWIFALLAFLMMRNPQEEEGEANQGGNANANANANTQG